MNENLAERLLATVMKWKPSDVAKERPNLQALATLKYDDYQWFSPGMKFIESLALWLKQFSTLEERKTAYEFMRDRIVFISVKEMYHLVGISYPLHIRPFLIGKVATVKKVPAWFVRRIVDSIEFRVLLRQSLFLGLSDGAYIDVFRRSNPWLSHEQIFRTHEISEERAAEMLSNLKEDLNHILGRASTSAENRFRMVFLFDDFSGSGISYIREEASHFAGKISRFQKGACNKRGRIRDLFEPSELHVCLVLYVASEQARNYLEVKGRLLFGVVPFDVLVVNPLSNSLRVTEERDEKFIEILKKYYDPSIETESYLKGTHDRPYLGFNECALPLVLGHNTPNNSVCLLWYPEKGKYRGLFPRVSRHRDEP